MSFNLAFFSSSWFTVQILEDIYSQQGKPLIDVYNKQLQWLHNELPKDLEIVFFKPLNDIPTQLASLLQQELNLKLVVSQPDNIHRSKVISNPISQFSKDQNLPLWTPEKVSKELEYFEKESIDLAVTASFGQILSQKTLNASKFGFINWHPSLLPLYRGPTPMQSSLRDGQAQSGLSWIEMTKKMDAGSILCQLSHNIDNFTFTTLAEYEGLIGKHTWALATVSKIAIALELEEGLTQNESEVTFCEMLNKDLKLVDHKKTSAEELYNHFRAYQEFPGTVITDLDYFKQEIKLVDINKTDSLNPENIIYQNPAWVQTKSSETGLQTFLKCADKSFLKINKVRLSTGKEVNFQGFLFT